MHLLISCHKHNFPLSLLLGKVLCSVMQESPIQSWNRKAFTLREKLPWYELSVLVAALLVLNEDFDILTNIASASKDFSVVACPECLAYCIVLQPLPSQIRLKATQHLSNN